MALRSGNPLAATEHLHRTMGPWLGFANPEPRSPTVVKHLRIVTTFGESGSRLKKR